MHTPICHYNILVGCDAICIAENIWNLIDHAHACNLSFCKCLTKYHMKPNAKEVYTTYLLMNKFHWSKFCTINNTLPMAENMSSWKKFLEQNSIEKETSRSNLIIYSTFYENMIPTPKNNAGKCYSTQLLTHLVVEISLHPCVTSDRSFSVVPTYTKARVIGWKKIRLATKVTSTW